MRAVIFDLDDTLYPQSEWLAGAFEAVAEAAAIHGVDRAQMRSALDAALESGSDSGHVIDRALELAAGDARVLVGELVRAFRGYLPGRLTPYPGVVEALETLAASVPLALVTDGDPPGQRGKLEGLGLARCFSVVVYSDDLGRHRRKPDPAGMIEALARLGERAEHVVAVGDRPDKDVAAASAARIRAVRVRTGEYAGRPDHHQTWRTVASVPDAAALIEPLLESGARIVSTPRRSLR